VTTTIDGLPLFDGSFWEDPYPAFDALRDAEPVRVVEMSGSPTWFLTRYEDVRSALNDQRFSKDWRWTLPEEQRAATPATQVPMMILLDPPDHTRLRRLVSRSFTLRRMNALRPRVEQIATDLLDAMEKQAANGETVDLLREYAVLLPVEVICELLGVPSSDRADFVAWSNALVDETGQDATRQGMANLHRYLGELVEGKRAEPDDALLSGLIEVSEDGDVLSHEELVAMGIMLLVAGHETTVNLIGNAVLGLLRHPEQRARVTADPELTPKLVEEVLRHDSPIQNAPHRFTSEDVEIGGTTIPAGSPVVLSLGAANRDPRRFPDAADLQIERDVQGHVAFGHGLHHCLGAQLARIEGDVAVRFLLARFPDLAAAVPFEELVYRQSTLVRGVKSFPVTLRA
jgi:cytochrome P450